MVNKTYGSSSAHIRDRWHITIKAFIWNLKFELVKIGLIQYSFKCNSGV